MNFSAQQIVVTDVEDVWAVNISGSQFDYNHDCTGTTVGCTYSWNHAGFTRSVTLSFGSASCFCSSCSTDYHLSCSYSAPMLRSTLIINKPIAANNTKVSVSGSFISGVSPVEILLDCKFYHFLGLVFTIDVIVLLHRTVQYVSISKPM